MTTANASPCVATAPGTHRTVPAGVPGRAGDCDVLAGARWDVRHGDALDVLRGLPDGCVDAVVTDPPYPEVDRPYGRWTVAEWRALVDPVVREVRRVLTPTGSSVWILQPNSERVGRMRSWLWRWMADWYEEWNCPQDAWWWNHATAPTIHCHRTIGLMRPSLKPCVWLGPVDCYRDQSAVLWEQSASNAAKSREDRALRNYPSGQTVRPGRCVAVADERGGTTPFNVLPIANTNSTDSAGSNGHSAGTPDPLARWWTRYLTPPGGLVCDPFGGSGTVARAALAEGCRALLVEREAEYVEIARARLRATAARPLGHRTAPERARQGELL